MKLKFVKITSISPKYFNDFGDTSNCHKQFYNRKFGNIKDPKQGFRPYLLFKNPEDEKIKWIVPSTSQVNEDKQKLISNNPEWFLKYYCFKMKEKQIACFEFRNISPITDKYLLEYKISHRDFFCYLHSGICSIKNEEFLLKQIINTNYFISNNLPLGTYSLHPNNDEWQKIIQIIELKANNVLNNKKIRPLAKTKKLIIFLKKE